MEPATLLAIVTGAGSGIGRACAEQLAARGLHVVATGRRAEPLNELRDTATSRVTPVPADCATESGRDAVVDTVRSLDLPVAAVIHAAGDDLVAPFAATTAAQVQHLLEINLLAPFFLTQALLPRLAPNAGIVFVGSISAVHGRDRHAAYGASKAALIGLTANLAVELGPQARVNCVSPGATRTALLRSYVKASHLDMSDEERTRAGIADAARLVLGRVAEPAEVASMCVHLALDATAVTGVDIPVDVGYTAS